MVRIPSEKIDEIRGSADIVAYISRYVRLKKSGRNMFGLCPFHQEKTPSFSVSPEKQIFHCFGCSKGGDVLSFLMEIEKISYVEAIRRIGFDLGISLPSASETKSTESQDTYDKYYSINQKVKTFFVDQFKETKQSFAQNYIKKRKLKTSTISKFSIGFAPNKWDGLLKDDIVKGLSKNDLSELGLIQKREKENKYFDKFRNRLMFPFHSISGRIIGFGGRRLNEEDQPKYLNSPESKIYKKGDILYGLHQAIPSIREKDMVILVEGYFDLLRLVDAGFENVVASSGTALTEKQGRLLKRYTTNVTISYDSDEAGLKAAIRISDILESLDFSVSILQLPVPHDPDSFILEQGKNAFFQLLKNKKNPLEVRLSKFFSDYPNPSLEQKNKLVDEIIYELISYKNDVKIGFYLHKLSENLEITESLLVSRFNKLKSKRKYYSVNNTAKENKPDKIFSNIRKGEWRAEEGILSILINGKPKIIKHILNNLSSSDFENDDLQKIFEIIVNFWEEENQIKISQIQDELDTEHKSTFSKLSLLEIDNTDKFVKDCVYRLKKWHLNSRYSEIRKMLQEEVASPKSVTHYMKELTQVKKKLMDIENEHYPKNNL